MTDQTTLSRPSGTVTFLFTDIEGSTRAWDRSPGQMPAVLARHDRLLREAIARQGGYVFATGGDGFAVAFGRAEAAARAAADAQRALRGEQWPDDLPIRVRMGMHTGEADERDDDYFGVVVNRAARLMAVANGSQVVMSHTTADLLGTLPDACALEHLGQHELKDLRQPEAIHELVVDGLRGPTVRAVSRTEARLPSFPTSFIGRRAELAELSQLTQHARLVTIVGPGGVGKTRTSVEYGRTVVDQHRDGVWFVDLSEAESEHIASAVLTGVSLASTGDWGSLPAWDALIILDNCEHVLDAVADAIEDLLASCPTVHVIATSREPLAVAGEQVMRIGPMADETGRGIAPGDGPTDAIGLFLDRARLADPSFETSGEDLAVVADLCAQLDGLPLAIELAAARVDRYALEELAQSLLSGVPDRRDRRRTERHRGLDAAVRWSHELMDQPVRTVFRRLSVFPGDFSAEAAVVVAGGAEGGGDRVRASLAALVDQSMLEARRTLGGTRYAMLRTIRSFAGRQLDEAGETAHVRNRHLEWVAEWSVAHHVDLDRPGWVGLTTETSSQRAALSHALDVGDVTRAVDVFAASLMSLLSAGMVDEARATLASLHILADGSDAHVASRLLECEMMLAEIVGDFDRSHALAEGFRKEEVTPRWYLSSAIVIHHLAATAPDEALTVLEEFESHAGVVPMGSYLRAEVALGQSRFADAVDDIAAALGVGDVSSLDKSKLGPLDPAVLIDLAVALQVLGRDDEAAIVVDVAADQPSPGLGMYQALLQGLVHCRRAPGAQVTEYLARTIELQRRWAPPLADLDCVVHGAFIAATLDRPEVAAEALSVTRGKPQRTLSAFGLRRVLRRRLNAELGDDGWQAATAAGHALAPMEAFGRLVDALGP